MNVSVQTPEYVARIQLYYNKMRISEQKLADYLLARDLEKPLEDNVRQLAQNAGVSVASVVRFCQELGYSGYGEFKMMTRQVGFLPTVGNFVLDSSVSATTLKKNICDFTSVNIQRCAQTLADNEVDSAISAILRAKKLLICGIGTSAGIAVAAANTFIQLGVPSFPLSEELLMLRTASMLSKDDVVLAITNCGYVKPIVDVLMQSKEAGATTLLITGEEKSLARKYADHVLFPCTYGSPGVLDMLTVTSCQLTTIQILQAGCLARGDKSILNSVSQNTALVEMARYNTNVDSVKKERVRF